MKDNLQGSTTYLAHSQVKRLIKIALLSGVTLCACAIIFVIIVVLSEEGGRWKTSRHLPGAREEFNSQLAVINQIMQGTMITEDLIAPGVPEIYFHHCIFADDTRVYGTDQSYEEIIADYATAFTQLGWTHDPRSENIHMFYIWIEPEPPVRPTPSWGHNASYRHRIIIRPKSPESDSSNDFLTYYELNYQYRYPITSVCTA